MALAEVDSAKAKAAQIVADANDKGAGHHNANGEADHIKGTGYRCRKGETMRSPKQPPLARIFGAGLPLRPNSPHWMMPLARATDRAERMTKAADDAEGPPGQGQAQIQRWQRYDGLAMANSRVVATVAAIAIAVPAEGIRQIAYGDIAQPSLFTVCYGETQFTSCLGRFSSIASVGRVEHIYAAGG